MCTVAVAVRCTSFVLCAVLAAALAAGVGPWRRSGDRALAAPKARCLGKLSVRSRRIRILIEHVPLKIRGWTRDLRALEHPEGRERGRTGCLLRRTPGGHPPAAFCLRLAFRRPQTTRRGRRNRSTLLQGEPAVRVWRGVILIKKSFYCH